MAYKRSRSFWGSDAEGSEEVGPLHKILHEFFAALLVEDMDLGKEIWLVLLALIGLEVVFPVFVGGFALGLVGLDGVVLGHVLAQDQVKLQEGGGLANPADPEQEDGEMRVGDLDLALRVILNELLDVH